MNALNLLTEPTAPLAFPHALLAALLLYTNFNTFSTFSSLQGFYSSSALPAASALYECYSNFSKETGSLSSNLACKFFIHSNAVFLIFGIESIPTYN